MASFNKIDKEWLATSLKQNDYTEAEKAILVSAFDSQTDHDAEQIKVRMAKEKYARRICFRRIVTYPFQYVFLKLMFTPKPVMENWSKVNKIYKAYYKKKIDYIEFQKRLAKFMQESKLLK